MRNRNMLRLTGLPGWMRFGYSPGWVGRSSSGLGPCAEYLMTGSWPAGIQGPTQFVAPPATGLAAQMTALQESIQSLAARVAAMEQRLAAVGSVGVREGSQ